MIRVELLVDGVWTDSGREFQTRFDASEFGFSAGGDSVGYDGCKNRNHSIYGYDTQDRTWRIVEA